MAKETGIADDRRSVTYWDPESQSYKTKQINQEDWKEYSPGKGKYGWYTNSQGDRVYGLMPESYHLTYDDGYEMVEGPDPNWEPIVTPDRLGMSRTGYQRTPSNTVDDPDLPWQGSPSHDPEGNVVPGGPADPFTSPSSPQNPINQRYVAPYEGITTPELGAGGGAIAGPSPYARQLQDVAAEVDRLTPRFGWEASVNRDFYQDQFKRLREGQVRNKMRADAAALRAGAPGQGAAPPPSDPWGWANLPEVVQGGATQGGVAPGDWVLNPEYQWGPETTNAQMISSMGGILNPDEQAMINAHMQTNPNWQTSVSWANQPREEVWARTFGGSNEQGPEWAGVLQKILNNVWVQAGEAPTPGGFPVPAGYASPINA